MSLSELVPFREGGDSLEENATAQRRNDVETLEVAIAWGAAMCERSPVPRC